MSQKGLPSVSDLEKASNLQVYDEKGNKVTFFSLFGTKKTVVIWIRHFYCGLCQQYVSSITEQIKLAQLEAAGANIVFIGCGDYQLIGPYRKLLETPYAIYADPTRSTYKALGMTIRSWERGKDGETGSYAKKSFWADVKDSVVDGLKMGLRFVGKQGDMKQLGGEYILGPGLQCEYAHVMQNTRDHTEVKELKDLLRLSS